MADKDIRYKDELDFKVYVKKIRHRFIETVCPQCGHVEKQAIPTNLKEEINMENKFKQWH